NGPEWDYEPSWSLDGNRIAFVSQRGRCDCLYVMAPDGSAVTTLTRHDSWWGDRRPSWSPDGQTIVFTRFLADNVDVYRIAADGSAETALTHTDFHRTAREPQWSPDGSRIAFSTSRDDDTEIYVMNADGSTQTRLTNTSGVDEEPRWSPDGSRIAFTSHRDGTAQIYVMNADGSGQTRLTNTSGDNTDPSWSPAYSPSRAPANVDFTIPPPPTVKANDVISPAIQVTVTDASWHPVPGGVVHIEIGTSPTPGATLSGTTEAKVVDGVATFADLRIDQAGRGYTLRAVTGAASGSSGTFTVAGPAAQLGFVTQPPGTVEGGTPIVRAVRVAIQDALGTTVPGATQVVTMALAANPPGATLSGTTAVGAVDGVATFNNLSIDRPGTYTLSAAAAGLTGATSSPVAVHLTFSSVNTGTHTCAITTFGKAYCWGYPQYGTLGNGGTDPHSTPVAVVGGLSFVGISTGARHSCGLAVGGAAYCWGHNIQGGLGDGTTSDRTSPVPLSGGLTFRTVSAGEEFSCGVTTGGRVFCW